jgi:hypothetical protein
MPNLWGKIKGIASAIDVFSLHSFILVLLKNQTDKSRVYLLCVITAIYVGILLIEHRVLLDRPDTMDKLTRRTRLIFRWIYVAVCLTTIVANIQMEHTSGPKLIYQIVMCVIISLTVPRDMLWRNRLKPIALNKWKNRKILRRSSHSVHSDKL